MLDSLLRCIKMSQCFWNASNFLSSCFVFFWDYVVRWAPSSGVRSPLRSGGSRRVSLKELGAWFPGFLTPAPTPAVFRGRQGGQRLEGATAHRTLCPNQGLTARLFSGRGRRRSRGRRPGNVTHARLSEGCTEHTGHASERGGKVWNPNRPEAHLQKKS